jgi:DNA-binding CsgD family transcriptional regulator
VLETVRTGGEAQTGLASLSTRETEVLEMAAQGLTNPEIAARLHVSIHAVKFHLAGVYRKLGVTNRTEAAVLFLRLSTHVVQRSA